MYFNQDIAARRVEYNSLSNIESTCLELSLRQCKWLLISIYKPPSSSEDAFIKRLFSCLTNVIKEFENIVLLGDFNMTAGNAKLEQSLNTFSLESLITSPTCFKSVTATILSKIYWEITRFHRRS